MPFVKESMITIQREMYGNSPGGRDLVKLDENESVVVLDYLPKHDVYLIERITDNGREVLEVSTRILELSVLGDRIIKDEEIRSYLSAIGIEGF